MSRLASARRAVTARGIAAVLVAVALAALAVGVDRLEPGPTARYAPFSASGSGLVTSGPLSVEVHDAELAATIVVDDEVRTTNGVFVVVEATIGWTGMTDFVARDLLVDGRVYDASSKGPTSFDESEPAAGLPVRGDLVFEVDPAALAADGTVELVVSMGIDAQGDLQPQVVVPLSIDPTVVDELTIEVVSR
ncbi:DUF4352 domain-containing protein [Agrococcus jejuensis]|uniref:DUF4352 domain-containing protein n=1 Tax=Agrococcus jejuensis TaxID=399736 RepID=A0A1G8APZ3_9MICO|nr:hypothetical protein [Agrococcus jejuensis]SDH23048.1 hypothetical protein SAMN04489720_0483 [Agrococcus jejuensis]